jgi:plastocyanin
VTYIKAALVAAALGITACGPANDEGRRAASPCPQGAVTIRMKDMRYQPKQTTVRVGRTVCWTNLEGVPHDAVAREGAEFASDLFAKGGTFQTKLVQPGRVKYVCSIHRGMVGTLDVKP